MPTPAPRRWLSAALLSSAAALCGPASALIVQGDAAGIPVDPGVSGAFGTWGGNAAAIAVASNWVLTTRHQDLPNTPNRTVNFGGQSYTALANDPSSVVNLSPDLRLVRIVDAAGADANLTQTLQAYEGPTLTQGTALTFGGFGPSRGAAQPGGFDHAGADNNANGLRFGTNTFDGFSENTTPGDPFNGLNRLVADFDPAGSGDALASEATAGPGDSGGAWLVDDNGVLKIAGLTHAISTLVDDPSTPAVDESVGPDAFFGQLLFASDATAFASIINTIPEPTTAAVIALGAATLLRRRRARPRF